jgi:hypothetical protein
MEGNINNSCVGAIAKDQQFNFSFDWLLILINC